MESSLYYNNNTALKKSGIQEQFTDYQVQEITKCLTDISYFIRNYVYIVSLDEGRVLFDLYDYEQEMIDLFNNNKYVIIRASRQMRKNHHSSRISSLVYHIQS